MKPRRVSSSRSSSASSSRKPPIENSGVRSSCDAFATNSFRALSSCASCTRIASNARASSPISSLPWSTIGAPKSPPAIRSAAVSSRSSRCDSIPGGGQSEDQRKRERESGRQEQALTYEAHRRKRVAERREKQHDCLVSERNGDVRVVDGAVQRAASLEPAALQRCQRNLVGGDVPRVAGLRVRECCESGPVLRQDVERDDASVRRDREALDRLLPQHPILRRASGREARRASAADRGAHRRVAVRMTARRSRMRCRALRPRSRRAPAPCGS